MLIIKAVLVGGYIVANQNMPCPGDWGWIKDSTWQPHWTTLPDARTT